MALNSRMSVRDNGSNYPQNDRIEKGLPSRSVFDLSYLNTLTAEQGKLIPVMSAHSLMNEDYNFGLECIVRVVNPPVVPLVSRQRVFFHTFWCSYTQLWKQAQIFFDKGKLCLEPPTDLVLPSAPFPYSGSTPSVSLSENPYVCRGSLTDFLGFNFSDYSYNEDSVRGLGAALLPVLKYMMYLKIWRDYYCNKRIFAAWLRKMHTSYPSKGYNKLANFLFPADEEDFRIGSSQWNAFISNTLCSEFFFKMKWRDWTDDYFTTMQISPTYSDDVPSIDFDVDLSNLRVNSNLTFADVDENTMNTAFPNGKNENGSTSSPFFGVSENEGGKIGLATFNGSNTHFIGDNENYAETSIAEALNTCIQSIISNTVDSSSVVVNGQITIDKLREVMAETRILEKLAKTDGTYDEFGYTMFGEHPKSARDMRPTYVGGTYQPIVFSQVLSNIPVTENQTTRPQGTATGLGLSSADGYIGSHHSDDYGIYMTIMSIMPDTYYCQGWQREDLYKTSDDYYLPERASLGMQAVMLSELYKNPVDLDCDTTLLGYQNRFDELRYRANEVHGKVADQNNASFSPYVQTRYFNSEPTLSEELLTTEGNISKKWLSSQSEVPYLVQVANKIRAVRPLPFYAQPADFGM